MAVINNDALAKSVEQVLEGKGSKKFVQTVELIVNFRGIDFSKPENRLNLEIPLPKGRGKNVKVAVFADGQAASDAKKAGADKVLGSDMIESLAKNRSELKNIVKEYSFLAEPKLMVSIGKNLGQVLGTRGKMPKPFVGKAEGLIDRVRRTVTIRTKGKYMPVIHVPVGTENMDANDILENINAVLESVRSKINETNIKNVYVKLTMGEPIKVG